MSDSFFDADRDSGLYPPKGWGWDEPENQRKRLKAHFAKENPRIEPWMLSECDRLGIPRPLLRTDKDPS